MATDKNGEGILDPTKHLMCYRVRTEPRRPDFTGGLFIDNQFEQVGPDQLKKVTRPTEFCVPSLLL